jgi:hypothetical protein
MKGPSVQPDQLVAELLARGDMNDETTLDLNRILSDWRAGTLDPDDEAYLAALHARITKTTPQAEDIQVSGARLEGLTIEEWRDRALKAETELAQLADAARNG